MKYVVLRERNSLGLVAVVFGVAPLSHKDLADAFARTHGPISAGFCSPQPTGRWRVFGFSSSLNLKPAAGDDLLIEASARATARIGEPHPGLAAASHA